MHRDQALDVGRGVRIPLSEIDLQTGLRDLVAWWRSEQLEGAMAASIPAGSTL